MKFKDTKEHVILDKNLLYKLIDFPKGNSENRKKV